MSFMKRSCIALSLLVSFLSACSDQRPVSDVAGSFESAGPVLVSSSLLAELDQASLTQKLANTGIVPRNGIKIFRLSYNTRTPHLEKVTASGVVIVPDTASSAYAWISLQHGTITAKSQAPSLSPSEGLAEASQGFVAVVPDYLGYGDTEELVHPYIIESGYTKSGVDMLRAAREFAKEQSIVLGPLFLKGYSEGGYATLALQKAIETHHSDEFSIVASAPASGPYDIEQTGLLAVQQPTVNPANLPFLLLSYNKWLALGSMPLSRIFLTDVQLVQDALSGLYTGEQIFEMLPEPTLELFESDFIDDFLLPYPKKWTAKQLRFLLKTQSLNQGRWVPKSPTRFYHCVDDEVVPVAITVATVATFKTAGAPVDSVLIDSADPAKPFRHGNCPAIFSSLQWFGEILNPPAP